MAEAAKEDTIVEEEEQNEEGAEGGEGEEGVASNELEDNVLDPGDTWQHHWQPEWDEVGSEPDVTYAYEPEVLSRETWKDLVHRHPATLVDLPNGVVTIARVPLPIANAVADPAGDMPPVLQEDYSMADDFDPSSEFGLHTVHWADEVEQTSQGMPDRTGRGHVQGA